MKDIAPITSPNRAVKRVTPSGDVLISSKDELERFYRSMIRELQLEAGYCGYALGVHGSMRRDLDLIAVPWNEQAKTPEYLAKRLHFKASRVTNLPSYYKTKWEDKPHGRRAIVLLLPSIVVLDQGLASIDLSVMPRIKTR